MRKQIIVGLILIVSGALLGFFVVVNWQLHQEIKKTATAIDQDSQELTKLEKYLNDDYVSPAPANQENNK